VIFIDIVNQSSTLFSCDYISNAGYKARTWLLKMPMNILY